MSDPSTEAAASNALRQSLLESSERFGVPSVDLGAVRLQLADLTLLPLEVARRHTVLPLLVKDDVLFLAMAAPDDRRAIDEVEFVSGKKVHPFVCDAEQLGATVDVAYERHAQGDALWSGPRAGESASVKPAPPAAPTAPTASVPPPPPPLPIKSRSATLLQGASRSASGEARAPRRIPAPPSATRSDPPVSPSVLPSALPPMLSPSGHTVLLVVGTDADRELLREAFSDLGHTVLEHPRFEGAEALIAEKRPELVVVESQLPDGHGYTLLAALRAKEEPAPGALVLLPGAAPRRVVDDLRDALGVRGVLERPIRAVDVLTRAEAVFENTPPSEPEDYLSPQAEVSLQSGVDAYQRGDLDDAIRFVEEGIAAAPGSYRLHYHHGLLLGRRGDVFGATKALERSLSIHDQYFPALRNLAVLYERAGFRRVAIEVWERAHAASPDDASRESIKARIVSLL